MWYNRQMVAFAKIPVRMSVAEFMDWHPGDGRRWQLVDGEPQAMAPGSTTHGLIQGETARLIGNHLLERDRPCRLIVEPGIVPRVQAAHNVRLPDLAVTCSPSEDDGVLLDRPVLVVEILSPGNQAQTWANVWTYCTIPSVLEILVLRTAEIRADLLRRNSDGSWPAEPMSLTDGILLLESIGLAVDPAGLYRTTKLRRD